MTSLHTVPENGGAREVLLYTPVPMQSRRTIAFTLAALGALGILLCFHYALVAGAQDVNIYRSIGEDILGLSTGGGAPFTKGYYPPLATALFAFLASHQFGLPFASAWLLLIFFSVAAIMFFHRRVDPDLHPAALPAALVASVVFLGPEVLLARYDIIIGILLFLAWRLGRSHRVFGAAFFLVLAGCLKIVPFLVLPFLWLSVPRGRRRALLIGAAAGAGVGVLLPMLFLSPTVFWQNVQTLAQFHAERGIHAESTWSGVLMLLQRLAGQASTLGLHHYAWNNLDLGAGTALASMAVILGGLALLFFFLRRCLRHGAHVLDVAVFLPLLWALLWAPVLSPQYFVWVIPLLFIFAAERLWIRSSDAAAAAILLLTIGIAAATQYVWPLHYGEYTGQSSFVVLLVHASRSAGMFALVALFIVTLLPFFYREGGSRSPPRTLRLRATLVFLLGFLLLFTVNGFFAPRIHPVSYELPSGVRGQTTLPLALPLADGTARITIPMVLPSVHPTVYTLTADGCVQELLVNGAAVPDVPRPWCDRYTRLRVHLGAALHPGMNVVSVTIAPVTASKVDRIEFHLRPDRADPIVALETAALLLMAALWALFLVANTRGTAPFLPLAFIALFGALLRALYVIATHPFTRDHDTWSHLEYIQLVGRSLTIPPAASGWEFHQSPLYYALAAPWVRLSELWNRPLTLVLSELQTFSLLLSFGTLAVGVWIGFLLFPPKRSRTQLLLFTGFLACLPAFIYVASRISNDALYGLLSFLIFAFMLRFWQRGNAHDWISFMTAISIGILTKASAVLFLPLALLLLLLRRGSGLRTKLFRGLLGVVLVALLAGWYPILRSQETQPIVFPFGNFQPGSPLYLENAPANLLTFNPRALIEHPFNNPWSDAHRRRYFPEFFFRSALFGETDIGAWGSSWRMTGSLIVALSLWLLLLGVIEVARSLRREPYRTLPLWLTLGVLLIASVAFRLKLHCACTQDVRYVPLIVVPVAYYVARGLVALPGKWRAIGFASAVAWMCLCALYVIALYFHA